MRTSMVKAVIGMAAILGSSTTCAVDRRGEPVGATEMGEPEYVGAASEGLTAAYCILNAHTDNGTVHFEGPKWLLASIEGAGPLLLDLRILQFINPAMSTTGNYKPDASAVSAAVGYSMTTRYGVNDFSRVTVDAGRFQRVEAYPAFQRTVWEIRDADCNVPLGVGASYKPIGVFFKVVNTMDVAIPDVGVRVFETLDDGSGVVVPGGPAPAGGGGRDGGSDGGSDGGPRDAGASG